jgi:surface protein
MPQITSASYNLGNFRQSVRANSFNRRNSGEFANQQNIIAERLRLENEAKLLKQKQIANRPKLAVLFNPNEYTQDALNFIDVIKDETKGSRYSIIFYTDLLKILEEQYNLGFRFFASPTIGSFSLYTYCIPFCKKYPDVLLITSYSTQYFENGILPFNIIRTSINDNYMIEYIVNDLLYNLNNLTFKATSTYYEPISNEINNDNPIFEKIVYIYTEKDTNGNQDTYSEGYGEQLKNEVKLQNGAIIFESFKIQDDNFILPQEVKTLLSENPVSGVNFKTSKKTMFILNSYSPEKILSLFDEEYMCDNYFIFGDVFPSNHYTSKYKFNYAICPLGNYSFEGYKIAGLLTGGSFLSPFLYSIMDIILKLLPYYSKHFYEFENLSSTNLMLSFIDRMKSLNIIVDKNQWYERKIFTYKIDTKFNDSTNSQYNYHIFFKYKFNPTYQGTSIPQVFIYSFINAYLPPFNLNYIPVINKNLSFTRLEASWVVSGLTTTVTIIFNYASDMTGNDGLSFSIINDKGKNIINDYYKNNAVIIKQFQNMPLSKAGSQFANLSKLKITATDSPIILPNTSLEKAFYNCADFNSNISNWDVSDVINMSYMFFGCSKFNKNLSSWSSKVFKVTNMSYMFYDSAFDNGGPGIPFSFSPHNSGDYIAQYYDNMTVWNVNTNLIADFMNNYYRPLYRKIGISTDAISTYIYAITIETPTILIYFYGKNPLL